MLLAGVKGNIPPSWGWQNMGAVPPDDNQSRKVCVTNFRSSDQRVLGQGYSSKAFLEYINPAFPQFEAIPLTHQVSQHLPLIIQSCGNREMSLAFSNNNNSFNNTTNTFNYTTPDDESKILAWLSPLEPWVRHRDIGAERVDGIGAWLLETTEFRRWHKSNREDESNHATLFCDGNPGVGKSYIM